MTFVIPGGTTPDEYQFGRPEKFEALDVGNVIEVEFEEESIGAEVIGLDHKIQPEFGKGRFDLRFICNEHDRVRVQMHRDMADEWPSPVAEAREEDTNDYEEIGEVQSVEVVAENRHAGGESE